MNVSKFERRAGNQESVMHISNESFDCNSFNILKTLDINELQVFQSASHHEKNNIMLSPDLFPKCIQSTPHLKRVRMSPYAYNSSPVLANLSTNGSLELSKHIFDVEDNKSKFECVQQLTELRKCEDKIEEPIRKLPKLIETFNKLSFLTFDWCPDFIQEGKLLIAALSKSREVFFYSVQNQQIVIKNFTYQLDSSVLIIKLITLVKAKLKIHYMLTGDKHGNFIFYQIELDNHHKVVGIKKVADILGDLRIPASEIVHEVIDNKILVIACKAHSIEAFLIIDNKVKSIKEYIGLSVTGIAKVSDSKPTYLISTLNNKIHYIEFNVSSNDLKLQSHQIVEYDSNDFPIKSYSAYGLSASRNKNFIFIALHPQVAYDHLEIKNATCIAIHSFSCVDPREILTSNPSKSLFGFYDCVEHLRYLISHDLKALTTFENFGEASTDDDFLYRLKLSLIAMKSNKTLLKLRSTESHQLARKAEDDVLKLIAALNAFKLLKNVKHSKNIAPLTESLRRFLQRYISHEDIDNEKFQSVRDKLKPIIEKDLQLYASKWGAISKELCLICSRSIDEKTTYCEMKHKLSRCMITQQQLPINCNNYCSYCFHPASDKVIIGQITDSILCIFCDRYLIFQQ